MSKKKRKALIRSAERIALTILVVDVLAYAALVLGLGKQIRAAQESREGLLRKGREEEARVARLKKFQASLPEVRNQLEQFEQKRVPSRRQGFSRAARLVREIGQRSGVEVSGVSYKLDSDRTKPLDRLGITVSAEGLYPSLVKFAHSLETASDFIVVREFSFQQGDSGALALRISADLYLAR
jgi:Tfp pilus assembly protein PilO